VRQPLLASKKAISVKSVITCSLFVVTDVSGERNASVFGIKELATLVTSQQADVSEKRAASICLAQHSQKSVKAVTTADVTYNWVQNRRKHIINQNISNTGNTKH
jgi:hypothetical protein